MVTISEGQVQLTFPDEWLAIKFDETEFYRSRGFDSEWGAKALDIMAYDPVNDTLWLIEEKDYSQLKTAVNVGKLMDDMKAKVLASMSLFGLAKVLDHGPKDSARKLTLGEFSRQCQTYVRVRVALVIKLPSGPRESPAHKLMMDIRDEAQRRLRQVDRSLVVLSDGSAPGVAWSVSRRAADL